MTRAIPRRALLVLSSWGGVTTHPVVVVAETPKRFRIRAISLTRLGGRDRWLDEGETALVPKSAIREE